MQQSMRAAPAHEGFVVELRAGESLACCALLLSTRAVSAREFACTRRTRLSSHGSADDGVLLHRLTPEKTA
jgi:hypothetical protein